MQEEKSKRLGVGRALHRKQVQGLHAKLEVLPNLPAHAQQGLFAVARSYDAWIRLSNGSMNKQSDRTPDIRGFGIRVLGVAGESALDGPARAQDFILINQEVFGFANSEIFVGLILAASRGAWAVPLFLIRKLGFGGGFSRLKALLKAQSLVFSGFGSEKFFSGAPISCGPYAARVRLVPPQQGKGPCADFVADLERQLAQGPLVYDLQLQFFVDEQTTPIEDASVNWQESEAPYVTVARLTIPSQSLKDETLAAQIEATTFDPWEALLQHKPLGEVMRARKVAYGGSQKSRGAV